MGSLISEDGYCEKEYNRTAMGKKIFTDKNKLFTGKLNMELKIWIMLQSMDVDASRQK